MSVRVDTLTPVLEAAPGELVIGRVRVVNEGSDDTAVHVRVIGLDGGRTTVDSGLIEAGCSAEVDVPFDVPEALGFGQHAVALEVSSDRPDQRPVLVRMTVSVESLDRVHLTALPSTVRAGRRGKFAIEVVNREPHPVDVGLSGTAPDVDVRVKPATLHLEAGERRRVKARVHGPLRLSGEPAHHVVTLTARGRSSSQSTMVSYIQRGFMPWRLRTALMALAMVVFWVLALVASLWWWGQRNDEAVDTSGSSGTVVDGALDPLDPSGGSGQPGSSGGGSGGGAGGGGGGDGEPGSSNLPTLTSVGGTVTTSGGDPSGVRVALAPIELGPGSSSDTAIMGAAGRGRPVAKLWSIRHAQRVSPVGPVRQTESVVTDETDPEGLWLFPDVAIRQNYEVVFSKAGYDTQSFVITPPADGSRVELDVELVPAVGSVSGVVVGPTGPLGGVEISVTDGTLTFATTTATTATGAAQVGGFSLEGLSTPGVYTLTATLRGYGTEVLQLPFSAGQQRTGTTISMRPGVGSISGRITVGNRPAGGVSVTASSGDFSVSTTSLTDGDTGSFSIPQLEIPGDYTVTASLDGFIAQTRRVSLTGNVTAVDFDLVPTTARITGRVLSSKDNDGIVGAGISVSVDDIGFRTATGSTPLPGNFDIDDLPPGTYLVRISRFDHLPYSQQVTVVAGQELDLGEIVMTYTERPPIPSTGSLVVRIFNSADDELGGATVTLDRVVVGDEPPFSDPRPLGPAESSVTFSNLSIGTYVVTVERPIYQTISRRISIGTTRRTEDFTLLKLGQASGKVVDTATNQSLRGYRYTLTGVDGPATGSVFANLEVPSNQPPVNGELRWRSPVDALLPGTYEIKIFSTTTSGELSGPLGYFVDPGQIIDDAVETTVKSMRFVVPDDSEEPVDVDDIKAVPYPHIGGRLFQPPAVWTSGSATEVVPFGISQVEQWAGLEVRLVCGDAGTEKAALADVAPLDLTGIAPYPDYSLPDRGYHFQFSPFLIQREGLLGACKIEVTAPGYATSTVQLSTPVIVGVGPERRDRTVNVPMLRPISAMRGQVYWSDGSNEIPIPGVSIVTDGDTITGYRGAQSDGGVELVPQPDQGSIEVSSDANGDWTLTGHVAGPSVYTFTDTGQLANDADGQPGTRQFADGTLRVTVNRDGSRTVEPLDNVAYQLRNGRHFVRLSSPLPGTLEGQIGITTTKSAPDFAGVRLTTDGPGTAQDQTRVQVPYIDTENPRTFRIPDAAAGRWRVTFIPPANHDFFGGAPTMVEDRIDPARTNASFDTTLVELGTLSFDVTYVDTPADAPARTDRPAATYTLTGDLLGSARSGSADSGVLDRLPVDPDDPLDPENEASYEFTVRNAGYDRDRATVTVTRGEDEWEYSSTTAIPFGLLAGDDIDVDIELEQYGRLVGSVEGEIWPDESRRELPYTGTDGPLDVTAVRVLDAEGEAVTNDPDIPDEPDDEIDVQPGDDGTFVVSGPPGLYRITVSHPNFQGPRSADLPSGEVQPDGEVLYRIENTEENVLATPWVLPIERGALDLTVAASAGFESPINGATATLRRVSTGAAVRTGLLTNLQGELSITDLVPDLYELEVRYLDADGDAAFPVIVQLRIPEAAELVDRTVTVTAILPLLQASISGTITAVNNLTPAGAVPVPTGVVVFREFVPPAVQISSGTIGAVTVPNEATDTDVSTDPGYQTQTAEVQPGGLSATFGFPDVAGGTHRLVIPAAPPGYTLLSPPSVDGPSLGYDEGTRVITVAVDDSKFIEPALVSIVYVASGVDVQVELSYPAGSMVLPERSVTLESAPGVPVSGTFVGRTPATPTAAQPFVDTFMFRNVAPRQAAYTLTITDPLHGTDPPSPIAVVVEPDGDGELSDQNRPLQVEEVDMVANAARISGTVRQQDAQGGTPVALGCGTGETCEATVRLKQGGTVVQTFPYDGSGTYRFDVTSTGTYTVEVARPGYTTESSADIAVTLGRESAVLPITVRKQATVTVTVTNDPPADTTVVGVPVVSGVEGTAFTGTRVDTVWTFLVDPGVQYRFRASRAGHYTVTYPSPTANPNTYAATIGDTEAFGPTTLVPRTVNIDVTGVSSTQDTLVPLTVSVVIGTGDTAVTSTKVVNADTDGSTRVTFTSIDTAAGDVRPLPLTGTGTATVSASGFRSNNRAIAQSSLANPTQTVSVPLRPTVTSATGTITNQPAGLTTGVTVSAFFGTETTARYTAVTSVEEDDYGDFTFEGANVVFEPGTWTFTAAILRVGADSETFTVTGDSPTGTEITVPDLTLVARDVTVHFDLTNVPATGATVTLGGTAAAAPLPATPNRYTFTIKENATGTALDYVVSAAARLTQRGSIEVTGLTVTRSIALVTSPVLSGTVTGGTGNMTITLRRACGTAVSPAINATIGQGNASYTFSANAVKETGAHCIRATKPQGQTTVTVDVTFTVNADGTTTPASNTLNIVFT
jgi:hypothetical protein